MGYQIDINSLLHPLAALNKANGVSDGSQMNGEKTYADNISMGTMLVTPSVSPAAQIDGNNNADPNGTLLTTGSRS